MVRDWAQQFYELAGFTFGAAVLAIVGAFGSLAFAVKPTRGQSIFIVFCGIGTGSAGSSVLTGYFKVAPVVGAGAAFFLAICAMPLLGLMFGVVESLRHRKDKIADKIVDRIPGGDPAKPRHPEAP